MKIYKPEQNQAETSVFSRTLNTFSKKVKHLLSCLKTNKKCYPNTTYDIDNTKYAERIEKLETDIKHMNYQLFEHNKVNSSLNNEIQKLKLDIKYLNRQLSNKREFSFCTQQRCCQKTINCMKKSDSCPECLDNSKSKKVKIV